MLENMGSLEEEALVNGSLSVTPGDSALVSSTQGWSPHLRDLHVLSISFLFVFLAYSSLQNLESSIHGDDGLGSTSVGVLYLSLTFSSLAAPLFVVWLGSKSAMLVGLSGYWAFTSANLYPTWVTMIPASLFLGFTASILWCAEKLVVISPLLLAWLLCYSSTVGDFQPLCIVKPFKPGCPEERENHQSQNFVHRPAVPLGPILGYFVTIIICGPFIAYCTPGTYLTFAAKSHAVSCDISEESAIGSFNGEFWGIYASNQVVGNLLTLALLYYAKGTASGTTLLIIVFLGSMAVGTALAFSLRPQDPSYMTISEDILPSAPTKIQDLMKRMFALIREKKMVLLIWVLVYSGFQQAFIWGDFTKEIITPAFGVAWVGGVMALYGASDAISSVVAGRFSTGLPAIAVIIGMGATAQGLALVLLLFKQQYGGGWLDSLLLSGLAIAWGVGDAAFNTQISALLGIFYPDDTEAAFAQWKIWQSAATSAAFFASPRTDFFIKLYVLLALLVLSIAALLFVIMRHIGWGNRRQ